jgi:hypothetical protein
LETLLWHKVGILHGQGNPKAKLIVSIDLNFYTTFQGNLLSRLLNHSFLLVPTTVAIPCMWIARIAVPRVMEMENEIHQNLISLWSSLFYHIFQWPHWLYFMIWFVIMTIDNSILDSIVIFILNKSVVIERQNFHDKFPLFPSIFHFSMEE